MAKKQALDLHSSLPKVAGSNPAPATNSVNGKAELLALPFCSYNSCPSDYLFYSITFPFNISYSDGFSRLFLLRESILAATNL